VAERADTVLPVSASRKSVQSTENSGKNSGRRGRPENLTPWSKGVSGNPGGRPKGHDYLRELIQELAAEKASPRAKSIRIVALLNKMFSSRDARDHANILEHGFGKVPQAVEMSGDMELLTPEQMEKKRQQRWEQVAPALAAALAEEPPGE
jgi:Family of unknown function (DUF5681)